MTTVQYVPIIKGKAADLKAVGRLDPKLRTAIKPLIEALPLNPEKRTLDDHVFTFCDYIRKHVPLGEVFVDFYGVMPDALVSEGTNAILCGYQVLKGLGRIVTPVFGLERNDELWPELGKLVHGFGTGFAFRLRRDDLADELHEETWQQITERAAEMGLAEHQIDVIVDFAEVAPDEQDALASLTSAFLFTNPRIRNYRSIIVAASSALRTVSDIAKDNMGSVVRSELHLWSKLWLDMPDDVKPIFADYGIVHPDFSDISRSLNMNAKIRYTVGDKILYFRGHGLLRPVKDYGQYHALAERVVRDWRYKGRRHSIGDAFVEDCARKLIGHGTPEKWIEADMNHHVTYTCQQVGRLLKEFAASP